MAVNDGTDINNTSIVLIVYYGNTSFLFTGDAEREVEQAILNRGTSLSATVLKIGHHGSDSSTTYPFLREVMPQYAVISVGSDNNYGHPTDDTLSRLRDADVIVYRTDLQGDITVTSDGKSVTISTEKSASKDAIMKSGSVTTTIPFSSVASPQPSTIQDPEPPQSEYVGSDYIININTGKFRYPSCSSVKK